VDIVVSNPGGGKAVFSQKFDYLPAPSPSAHTSNGYFVYEDFSNFPAITGCGPRQSAGNSSFQPTGQTWVVVTPVTNCTGISIDTTFGHSGTRSLRTSGSDGFLVYGSSSVGGSFNLNGALEPNGLYQRYDFYIAQADIDNALNFFKSHTTQWKEIIARYDGPGFMLGTGNLFGSSTTWTVQHSCAGCDSDPYVPAAFNGGNFWGTGVPLTGGWHEVQIWQQRNPSWTYSGCTAVTGRSTYGKAKVWFDGKLVLNITRGCTIGNLPGAGQGLMFGSYTDNGPPFTQWFDDIVWANGFIDP